MFYIASLIRFSASCSLLCCSLVLSIYNRTIHIMHHRILYFIYISTMPCVCLLCCTAHFDVHIQMMKKEGFVPFARRRRRLSRSLSGSFGVCRFYATRNAHRQRQQSNGCQSVVLSPSLYISAPPALRRTKKGLRMLLPGMTKVGARALAWVAIWPPTIGYH